MGTANSSIWWKKLGWKCLAPGTSVRKNLGTLTARVSTSAKRCGRNGNLRGLLFAMNVSSMARLAIRETVAVQNAPAKNILEICLTPFRIW